jgi:hypothetical protein
MLRPGQTFAFVVCVCPTREGSFSSLLLISTSKGLVPYSVNGFALLERQGFASAPVFYHSCKYDMDLTLRIQHITPGNSLTIFYDGTFFDRISLLRDSDSIQLHPQRLISGYVWSFVHIVTERDWHSYPLCISAAQSMLLARDPTAYLPMVTDPGGISVANVSVRNPTPSSLEVKTITLHHTAPPNLEFVPVQLPINCTQYAETYLGRLVMSGSRAGEVRTQAVIGFALNEQSNGTLEIPIQGFVNYGRLEPSTPAIYLLQTDGNEARISFTNHSAVPVLVAGAHVNSPYFVVIDFVPFVLQPNTQSRDIIVKAKNPPASVNVETVLRVETNATNNEIPVHGYLGKLTVARNTARLAERRASMHVTVGKGRVCPRCG